MEWAAANGATHDLVQAVVGFADLENPEVADILDAQAQRAPLRGIRQQLHWHANPAYSCAQTPDVMLRPTWQRGLREVAQRGLLFELQVFPHQFRDALTMVDVFPGMTFVLLHAGMPEDPDPDARKRWRAGLTEFAQRQNVHVKLSGLGTFTRSCRLTDWQPIIEQTLEVFGPARCVFGSNFPIESLWTNYAHLIDVVLTSMSHLGSADRQRVLAGNARELYRLSSGPP